MIDTKYDTKFNGCEKMSSWDKLLKRFLELDHDIRFEEIVKVMKEYGKTGIPIAVIDSGDYGMMNGEKVLKTAIKMMRAVGK